MEKRRTIDDINVKIASGAAGVYTIQELIDAAKSGEEFSFDDVDVVTTATKGLMSGIMGIFSFRVAPPRMHRKFIEISINGVPGFSGPCPNEFLGIVDFIIYGTAQSSTCEEYSGGNLFRDLVEGKEVHVLAKSNDGTTVEQQITLEDMQYARMMGTRQAIKNYNAMINPTTEPVDTIFSVLPFQPDCSEITFSGCGALNPFQNDPTFEIFGVGSPLLVNGARGYLIGPGTRNYVGKPNMMTIVDFKGMKPEYMGAFKTSYGLEPVCSIAAPIPITSEGVFANLVTSDFDVPLTILNLVGREKVGETTYGDVWNGNYLITFDGDKCDDCDPCPVEVKCPMKAFKIVPGIDRTRCFNCGACVGMCEQGAFYGDLKSVKVLGKDVPVVLRQSDKHGAIKLAEELKHLLLAGQFHLAKPTASITFADEVK